MTDEANGAYNEASQQVTSLTQQLREAKATTERYLRDFEALSRFVVENVQCMWGQTTLRCASSLLFDSFNTPYKISLLYASPSRLHFFSFSVSFLFVLFQSLDHCLDDISRTAKVTEEYAESVKKVQALHVAANMAEKEDKLKREEIGRLMTDKNTVRGYARDLVGMYTLAFILSVISL